VAETSGLLNRRTGNSRTEGSNPSVSASAVLASIRDQLQTVETASLSDLRRSAQALWVPYAE
jgi:hypothetical protein